MHLLAYDAAYQLVVTRVQSKFRVNYCSRCGEYVKYNRLHSYNEVILRIYNNRSINRFTSMFYVHVDWFMWFDSNFQIYQLISSHITWHQMYLYWIFNLRFLVQIFCCSTILQFKQLFSHKIIAVGYSKAYIGVIFIEFVENLQNVLSPVIRGKVSWMSVFRRL